MPSKIEDLIHMHRECKYKRVPIKTWGKTQGKTAGKGGWKE